MGEEGRREARRGLVSGTVSLACALTSVKGVHLAGTGVSAPRKSDIRHLEK